MQLALRIIAVLSFVVAIIWMIVAPGFEPLLAFLAGISTLLASLVVDKSKEVTETLDQRNRRVMLNHVENFWVKGVLEESLYGVALLELGIKQDPKAVSYPWTIKRQPTNENLPAGKSMLDIFQEVGMGRSLLILGAPGAGKSTMLLELARQLIAIARKDENEPIPVVFNLASWTEKLNLAHWLAEQLNTVYYVPKKIAPSWVESNKMRLLLDGLDEVKEDSRGKCVDAINQFRKEHGLTSVVVCSRLQEYSAIQSKLSFDGAISIQPLTAEQVATYIDRFGNSLASVRLLLRKDPGFMELAETPLVLSIIALAYKDRKVDELVANGNLEEERKRVFDSYITRMFGRSNYPPNTPFSKLQTLHYLNWLARTMTKHNIVIYQIETMQPEWLETRSQIYLYRLFFWSNFGAILGIAGGLLVGVMGGLIIGAVGALLFAAQNTGREKITLVGKLKWSWGLIQQGLIVGLISGLIFGSTFALLGESLGGPFVGLLLGFLLGLTTTLYARLISEQIEESTYPGQHLKETIFNAVSFGLIFWVGALLLGFLSSGMFGSASDILFGALSFGLLGALFNIGTSVLGHFALRLVLTRNELLPWRLIPFLDYAVDLIFLRRVGGSYIFVHRLLMEHFAEMDV